MDQICKCKYPHKVTHLIFDLDGTLLNSEILYNEAIAYACQSFGKEYTFNEEMKILGASSLTGARILIDCLGMPATIDEYLDVYHERANVLIPNSGFMPGAERIIKHFYEHGVPMAIATSSTQEGFDLKMQKHLDFLSMFSHYVLTTDEEVRKGKPFPDIFLVACQRFTPPPKPQNCLVFEDSPNGVRAAKAAHMQVVMIPESKVPNDLRKGATVVINSLEHFNPELFGLPPFK